MWFDSVPELKTLNVSNAEIGELTKAHDAGLTDPSCVALIKLARSRQIALRGRASPSRICFPQALRSRQCWNWRV